jgi:hypothetical protein
VLGAWQSSKNLTASIKAENGRSSGRRSSIEDTSLISEEGTGVRERRQEMAKREVRESSIKIASAIVLVGRAARMRREWMSCVEGVVREMLGGIRFVR